MNFSQEEPKSKTAPPSFHTLAAIITFILIPPMWFLSIPALIFSSEAKNLYHTGLIELCEVYREKAKRFIVASWAIFLTMASTFTILWFITHLSLI